MARRRRGGGGNRSAAAKKGWETRRRGGASKAKGTKTTPKTTTARGRARAAETRARAAVKGGGGTKATRSLLIAQRARDFYKATGTGTKRSKAGGNGGSRPAKATAAARSGKTRKPDFRPKGRNAVAQSTISESDARARLGSGRKLRGKGATPSSRAERVLQRGLLTGGKKGRRAVATAKRAIDYMAATGTGRKKRKR